MRKVKSSARTARHPSAPPLIGLEIFPVLLLTGIREPMSGVRPGSGALGDYRVAQAAGSCQDAAFQGALAGVTLGSISRKRLSRSVSLSG